MTQLLKYKSGKMTALSVIAFTATIVTMLASCDTAQLEIPEVQLTLRLSLPEAGEYNPQIQISAESETKRSIFREKDKTKRSKKESAQHSKSRNKSFVMTSVSAL